MSGRNATLLAPKNVDNFQPFFRQHKGDAINSMFPGRDSNQLWHQKQTYKEMKEICRKRKKPSHNFQEFFEKGNLPRLLAESRLRDLEKKFRGYQSANFFEGNAFE